MSEKIDFSQIQHRSKFQLHSPDPWIISSYPNILDMTNFYSDNDLNSLTSSLLRFKILLTLIASAFVNLVEILLKSI